MAARMFSRSGHKDSTTGLRGAYWTTRGKWQSKIFWKGRQYYLGYFYSPEDAHEAYMRALGNIMQNRAPVAAA
jgi:hypothetical protein